LATSSIPKLFQPIRVGIANLQRRVVLAPMTRCRADAQHVSGTLALEYYKQRTSVPGTLAITEATFIAARAGGYPNIPGIRNDEQVAGWKSVLYFSFRTLRWRFSPHRTDMTCIPLSPWQPEIVDVVHNNGSFIYLQLWALGRTV
jgi:NADPH2 dehydrogenase